MKTAKSIKRLALANVCHRLVYGIRFHADGKHLSWYLSGVIV
jgi:hypothetical protein